jgi:hypothetical protein
MTESRWPAWLENFGFIGERRALSLLCLSLLMAFYLFIGLTALSQTPEIAPYMLAMGAVYGVAFFAVGSEWFWARWFAMGVAWSGVLEAAFGVLSIVRMRGDLPPELVKLLLVFFVILGGLHGLAGVSLLGPRLAERYDARPDWRQRFHLDDQGALKLRRAVTRAATSLPMIIALALAPRQQQSLAIDAALGLVLVGLVAILRGRGAGLLALPVAAAALVGATALEPLRFAALDLSAASPLLPASFMPMLPLVAAALLLAAFAPFARPIATHLARRQ